MQVVPITVQASLKKKGGANNSLLLMFSCGADFTKGALLSLTSPLVSLFSCLWFGRVGALRFSYVVKARLLYLLQVIFSHLEVARGFAVGC